jgi:chromosome segregation ATPase
MFDGIPQNFLPWLAGAFALGYAVAKFSAFVADRIKARTRDPRDDRIRSLEAEHRIAKTDSGKANDEVESLTKELSENKDSIEARDTVIDEQIASIAQLRTDLKDSVKKTRELRAELSDRATESVRSVVKLREVETELEVTRASTDLIATGVLDYSMAPDGEDDEDLEERKIIKAVT